MDAAQLWATADITGASRTTILVSLAISVPATVLAAVIITWWQRRR